MATVPYQLDELIASLKTSHIGNEAVELAKLQKAQLQQSLQAYPQGGPFPTSPVQSPAFGPPANSPVSRTPSWASPLADPAATALPTGSNRRRRRSSIASAASFRAQLSRLDDDLYPSSTTSCPRYELDQDATMEDVEEEAEVDASLNHVPSSSNATSPIQLTYPGSTSHAYSPTYSPTTLAYALNDPFLSHQLQLAEQRSRQLSYFAQLATAQQHVSPFHRASPNPVSPAPPPPRDYPSPPSSQPYSQQPLRLTIDTSSPFTTHH